MDETVQEAVSVIVGEEEAMVGSTFWLAPDGLGDAPVKALDEPVGLWAEGARQTVSDFMAEANAV
jgi:hypothetical protein